MTDRFYTWRDYSRWRDGLLAWEIRDRNPDAQPTMKSQGYMGEEKARRLCAQMNADVARYQIAMLERDDT